MLDERLPKPNQSVANLSQTVIPEKKKPLSMTGALLVDDMSGAVFAQDTGLSGLWAPVAAFLAAKEA